MTHLDDFDTKIQPEELNVPEDWGLDERFETDNRPDAPDWDMEELQWDYMNGEYPDEE